MRKQILELFSACAFVVTAILYACILSTSGASAAESLRVPAFTAYAEPDPGAVNFAQGQPATNWKGGLETISWFGRINTAGSLHISVAAAADGASHAGALRLQVFHIGSRRAVLNRPVTIVSSDSTVDFGSTNIKTPGYYRFELSGEPNTGGSLISPDALVLEGPAADAAHFNLEERRNASSVHLGYPIPSDAKVVTFYNEVTVETDPLWSYYMLCGFRRGYFGIQVNSPTERRIIFSVWDAGNEAVDRGKVDADNRVKLLAKGKDVFAGDFGNEGTGGHSHLIYPWKKGERYRLAVTAAPNGDRTIYTGYFFDPIKQSWTLIASFSAPKDGGYLSGLYSFNEDFSGDNGQLRRSAIFGAPWIQTADGKWTRLTTAHFTHDPTGNVSRKDYGASTLGDRFRLSNGGFLDSDVPPVGLITLPAKDLTPPDFMAPSGDGSYDVFPLDRNPVIISHVDADGQQHVRGEHN